MVLALCACNRVLGLGDVGVRDAQLFDGLADAQPYCPALGDAPTFSATFHQIIDENCHYYTTSSAGLALALCAGEMSQGPTDAKLVLAQGFPANTISISQANPRISPEGDIAYVDMFDLDNIKSTYHSFTHVGGTTWTTGPLLPLPTYGAPSVPSRAPKRHLLFADYIARNVSEWAQDSGGVWRQVRIYQPDITVQHTWLAPDGQRALFIGYPNGSAVLQIEYLDRATIDDPFGAPRPVPSLPPTLDLFITGDCARAYMTSVASVFYADQI
jgi:hypothetical protein